MVKKSFTCSISYLWVCIWHYQGTFFYVWPVRLWIGIIKQQVSRIQENLTKPYILEYIRQRTAPAEQKRIASGDDVLRFFTRVMDGDEGADMPDRISAGREILKRDVSDRKLEIELLKLESKIGETTQESDIDDTLLEALNGTAMDVWGDSSGEVDRQ